MKGYVSAILPKINAGDRTQAALFAVKHGLERCRSLRLAGHGSEALEADGRAPRRPSRGAMPTPRSPPPTRRRRSMPRPRAPGHVGAAGRARRREPRPLGPRAPGVARPPATPSAPPRAARAGWPSGTCSTASARGAAAGSPGRGGCWTTARRDCVERGYLMMPQALQAIIGGDPAASQRLSPRPRRSASASATRDLAMIGRDGRRPVADPPGRDRARHGAARRGDGRGHRGRGCHPTSWATSTAASSTPARRRSTCAGHRSGRRHWCAGRRRSRSGRPIAAHVSSIARSCCSSTAHGPMRWARSSARATASPARR